MNLRCLRFNWTFQLPRLFQIKNKIAKILRNYWETSFHTGKLFMIWLRHFLKKPWFLKKFTCTYFSKKNVLIFLMSNCLPLLPNISHLQITNLSFFVGRMKNIFCFSLFSCTHNYILFQFPFLKSLHDLLFMYFFGQAWWFWILCNPSRFNFASLITTRLQ